MAADVSYLVRAMNGYKEEQQQQGSGKSKSTALITRDLLGGCSTIDSKELDLDLQVPCGYEKRLDLKVLSSLFGCLQNLVKKKLSENFGFLLEIKRIHF